jgi:hypothetical protein
MFEKVKDEVQQIGKKISIVKLLGEKAFNYIRDDLQVTPLDLIKLYTIWMNGGNMINNDVVKKIFKNGINSFIRTSPFELHLYAGSKGKELIQPPFGVQYPAYEYAGAGTQHIKRYEMGQRGINSMDNQAMKHDFIYGETKAGTDEDKQKRKIADNELMNSAERFTDKANNFLDVINGLIVFYAMKLKIENNIY